MSEAVMVPALLALGLLATYMWCRASEAERYAAKVYDMVDAYREALEDGSAEVTIRLDGEKVHYRVTRVDPAPPRLIGFRGDPNEEDDPA